MLGNADYAGRLDYEPAQDGKIARKYPSRSMERKRTVEMRRLSTTNPTPGRIRNESCELRAIHMEAHPNRNWIHPISVLILISCLFLTGCETLDWVQVNPPVGKHSMPGPETAEIIAIMDKVASQVGMWRLTQVGLDPLAKYQKNYRSVLFPKIVRSSYLTVETATQGNYLMPEGSILVSTSGYMPPDEHKILNTAKQALAERFGYDRVLIGKYHPFNF